MRKQGAWWFVLPVVAVGVALGTFVGARTGAPGEAPSAEVARLGVVRSVPDIPAARVTSALVLDKTARPASRATALLDEATRTRGGLILAGPAPGTETYAFRYRTGGVYALDWGNSDFGLYAPYAASVYHGLPLSSTTVESGTESRFWSDVWLFGYRKRLFDFEASNTHSHDTRVNAGQGRSYCYVALNGSTVLYTRNQGALTVPEVHLTVWKQTKTFTVACVPVEVVGEVGLYARGGLTSTAAAQTVRNQGGIQAGVFGDAKAGVGALGLGAGVGATVDLFEGSGSWNLAADLKQVTAESAALALNSMRVRVYVYVKTWFGTPTKTITQVGPYYNKSWPMSFRDL